MQGGLGGGRRMRGGGRTALFLWSAIFALSTPASAARLLLFPIEGRPDWAIPFYNALKAALMREGRFEVMDFAPESPIILRALMQRGLSPEEIAAARADPSRRIPVARRLGMDGAVWGEIGRRALRVFVADVRRERTRRIEFAILGEPTAFLQKLARQAVDRIEDIFPKPSGEPEAAPARPTKEQRAKAAELVKKAEGELKAGNPQEAVKLLYDALALDSTLLKARLLLSEAYEKMGRLNDALAMARMAALMSPKDPQLQCKVAELAMRTGNWEEAERAFTKALLLKPDDPFILKKLADFYMERGRPREAAEALRKVCRREPKDVEAKRALVEALIASGRSGEAVGVLREIAALRPKDPAPRVRAAVLLAQEGKHEEALAELAKAEGERVFLSKEDYLALMASMDDELVDILEGVRKAIEDLGRGAITREECFEIVSELLRRSERLVQLVGRLEVPAEFKEARAHRKLAHALTLQAMGNFLIYVDTNDLLSYHRAVVERDQAIKERRKARDLEEEIASKRSGG